MRFDLSKHWLIIFISLVFFYVCFSVLSSTKNEQFIPLPIPQDGGRFNEVLSSSKSASDIKPELINHTESTNVMTKPFDTSQEQRPKGATDLDITPQIQNATGRNFIVSQTPTILELASLTIHTNNGRLGNQMFLLGTLYGLCAINKRNLIMMPHTMSKISPYFNLDYPEVNMTTFVETNPYSIGQYLTDNDRHIPTDTNIIKGAFYPVSYTFFEEFREGVTRMYTFKQHLVEHADGVILTARKKYPNASVFIGVHVRRGDYLQTNGGVGWLKNYEAREVDIDYFQKATEYYKSKFTDPVFLVVSDDRRWCRKNLVKLGMDVTPESPSPGHDMALLSRCNHTLMTYGTFGFWGAYLAGGQTVYYSNFVPPDSDFAKSSYREDKLYLSDWVGISTTPPDYWNRTTTTTTIKSV